ncbi:MAG: ABC transporter substrate-binding protein [Anaerolineae bacterium]
MVVIVLIGTASALSMTSCGQRDRALDRIQANGVMRVAIDPSFPPFEFVNEDGQIAGFDVGLARAIADRLGVEARFITTGYDALYDALAVNHADLIISALYPDPSRYAHVNFSSAYFNAGQVLVVRSEDADSIAGVEDLAGRTVVCVFGTEGHMIALEWEEQLRPSPTLRTTEVPADVVALITGREVDAALVDSVSALMAQSRDPDLRILMPPITDEPYVIAAGREHADLMATIEGILEDLREDGTLDALTDHWMRPSP